MELSRTCLLVALYWPQNVSLRWDQRLNDCVLARRVFCFNGELPACYTSKSPSDVSVLHEPPIYKILALNVAQLGCQLDQPGVLNSLQVGARLGEALAISTF